MAKKKSVHVAIVGTRTLVARHHSTIKQHPDCGKAIIIKASTGPGIATEIVEKSGNLVDASHNTRATDAARPFLIQGKPLANGEVLEAEQRAAVTTAK